MIRLILWVALSISSFGFTLAAIGYIVSGTILNNMAYLAIGIVLLMMCLILRLAATLLLELGN